MEVEHSHPYVVESEHQHPCFEDFLKASRPEPGRGDERNRHSHWIPVQDDLHGVMDRVSRPEFLIPVERKHERAADFSRGPERPDEVPIKPPRRVA